MFKTFSDKSQIWVYGSENPLQENALKLVTQALTSFVESWQWHGQDVRGDFRIIENRFVVLVTDMNISGCSIDSSVSVMKSLKSTYDIDLLNQSLIYYRENNEIKSAERNEFQDLVQSGKVTSDSTVFNLMVSTLAELREGKFELAFKDSWHSRAFKKRDEAII